MAADVRRIGARSSVARIERNELQVQRVGRAAGLGRESLYKALSANGNPEFATVMKVIHALGLKLQVAA